MKNHPLDVSLGVVFCFFVFLALLRNKYLEKQSVDSHSHVWQLIKSILLQGFGFISCCWERGTGMQGKEGDWLSIAAIPSEQPNQICLDFQVVWMATLPIHDYSALSFLHGSNNLRLLMAASTHPAAGSQFFEPLTHKRRFLGERSARWMSLKFRVNIWVIQLPCRVNTTDTNHKKHAIGETSGFKTCT